MKTLIEVVSILVLGLAAILLILKIARNCPRPCYRCGVEASTDYMGLHYCRMCQIVVARMFPAVRHDPPYGFPGGPGILEFADTPAPVEKKKEG